jgi:hypothetical protein
VQNPAFSLIEILLESGGVHIALAKPIAIAISLRLFHLTSKTLSVAGESSQAGNI